MNKKLLFLVAVLCMSINSFSQTLDQYNTSTNAGYRVVLPNYYDMGQSFTCGLSGMLSQVAVSVDATNQFLPVVAGDFVLNVFEGEGYSGTELVTHNFTIVDDFHGELLLDFTDIPVNSGSVYTFRIIPAESSTGELTLNGANGNNPYSGGVMYSGSFGERPVSDLVFKTFVTVPPATHLNFDGVDDVVVCGTTLTNFLVGAKKISVEAMVKPETNFDLGTVLGNYDYPNTSSGAQFFIRRDYKDYIFSINNGSESIAVKASNTVTVGYWQHLAGVWDGSTIKIYIDGVLIATESAAAATGFPSVVNQFVMGSNANNEGFYGDIDDVRIWSSVLSDSDILNRKDCELQGNETGLLRYYKFNQGMDQEDNTAITTLTDATANGNTGTLTNFELTGIESNWLAGSPVITGLTIPSAPTASAQLFCEAGTVADLIATGGGGSLNWYNVASGGSVLTSTEVLASGNYYVSESNANGCESTRTNVVVTISDLTGSITLNQNVTCNGGTDGTATVSGSGGTAPYTYLWSNGETTAMITGLEAESYEVYITDANGCTYGTEANPILSVTITEPAALLGSITLNQNVTCNGGADGEATVSATGGTAPYIYSWSNGETAATNSGLGAGNYSVVITDANGCTYGTSVNPILSVTITEPTVLNTTISNNSNVLSVSESGATYQWGICDASGFVAITGETSQTYTPTAVGEYAVELTKNTCTAQSACFNVGTLGIDDFEDKNSIKIYPSPTNNKVTIVLKNEGDTQLSVYDINGRILLNQYLDDNDTSVNLSGFENGIYLFKIKTPTGEVVKRIIKN